MSKKKCDFLIIQRSVNSNNNYDSFLLLEINGLSRLVYLRVYLNYALSIGYNEFITFILLFL